MSERRFAALLFVLVALIALAFLDSPGTPDTAFWEKWTRAALALGLREGYAATGDVYPPLTLVVFDLSARAGGLAGLGILDSIKISLWCFLVLTGGLVWQWSGRPLLGAILMAALLLNSVALAYTDVYYAPFLLIALREAGAERWRRAVVAFATAALFKWLVLILAPFLLVFYLKQSEEGRAGGTGRLRWRRFATDVLLPAIAVLGVALACMGFEVLASLGRVRSLDPFLSGNALNLNWIVTHVLRATGWFGAAGLDHGEATYLETSDWRLTLPPLLLFVALYSAMVVSFARSRGGFDSLLASAQTGYLCYFMLATRVHENHLLPAVLVGAALMASQGRPNAAFSLWAVAANVNLVLFYGIDGRGLGFSRVVGVDAAVLLAGALLTIFGEQFLACRRALHPSTPAPAGRAWS